MYPRKALYTWRFPQTGFSLKVTDQDLASLISRLVNALVEVEFQDMKLEALVLELGYCNFHWQANESNRIKPPIFQLGLVRQSNVVLTSDGALSSRA